MSDQQPAISPEDLENAMRKMPAPVAVIGAAHEGILGGLTAAWVTRVSLDPPLLLVAVGHERFSWGLMSGSDQFTVSLPTEEQVPEARLFGLKSRRDVDKWSQVDHVLLGEGIPALEYCTARFLCRKTDVFTTGDHDCFVGLVIDAQTVGELPALPMRGGDYAPTNE